MAFETDRRTEGSPMFVHDFTAVADPPTAVVTRFGGVSAEVLGQAVISAWNQHAPILCAHIREPGAAFELTLSAVTVRIRRMHFRDGAAIVNLSWSSNGWLPDLDADLEIVGFGVTRTHLHLMGRYELPPAVDRFSESGSLVQRVMVMVVRTFLTDLAMLLAEPS